MPSSSTRSFTRRGFAAASLAGAASAASGFQTSKARVIRQPGSSVRLALNAYSFNQPLRDKSIDWNGVVDFCAQQGILALDATGYYFDSYPKVPSPATIHALKRHAFLNGVSICGTGVRNDFAVTDAAARARDVTMVKEWIEAASLLGASVIRVFTGLKVAEGTTFDKTLEWMIPAFQECAAHGARHGVIVGLQNHNDFARTAAETIRITEAVNSEWFGVILDVGSLRQADPYDEIAKLQPYAVSWQLKESVWFGAKEVPTDLERVKAIIDKGGYRGVLPIETLGAGDPKVKLARFLEKVRAVFG
ncbi:MAG TPA: sugar phosphate isomerase/epimerase family protein [Bryobacteraceae bacterium]|nr:sugar phosphate isomerase/epimerase family protein [Bryobacteraceae bacterium]HPT26877.1 sugar phosphate isomerase/epimerase family protein [Bryobacteraceae bacterium]